MEYNLILIDDEKGKRDAFADSLMQDSSLIIEAFPPEGIEETRDTILGKNVDGIILDLKLDGNKEGEEFADYTAPSLAQAIRSKFIEEDTVREVPIFLLTSQDKLERFYRYDLTSHNLFDYIFFKQKLGDENKYSKIIEEIVAGYIQISKKEKNLSVMLDIELEEISHVLFPSKFYVAEKVLLYDLSKYIIQQVIGRSGILIDENILAARLGLDKEKSEDWPELKKILKELEYSGLYSSLFPRWWSHRLNGWWRKTNPNTAPLISINADDKVKILIDKFGLEKLIPASPLPKAKNTRYWTICQVYKEPLDIRDGILLEDFELESWHDKSYISLESIVERTYLQKGLTIHPTEIERVKELKQAL